MEATKTCAGLSAYSPLESEAVPSRQQEISEHVLFFRGLLFAVSFGLLIWAAILRLAV